MCLCRRAEGQWPRSGFRGAFLRLLVNGRLGKNRACAELDGATLWPEDLPTAGKRYLDLSHDAEDSVFAPIFLMELAPSSSVGYHFGPCTPVSIHSAPLPPLVASPSASLLASFDNRVSAIPGDPPLRKIGPALPVLADTLLNVRRLRTSPVKILIISIFVAVVTVLHAAEKRMPFTLAIVPSSSRADMRVISTAKKQPHVFYVVLTNVSEQPQPTWETWNSWGFWTISFEFIMPDGKHITVTKNRNEDFTKNGPGTFLIPPGESQVYPIRLDAEWDNRPTFADAGDTPVTIKAIYKVATTAESTKYKVWTGRIASANYKVILIHW